MTTDTTSLYEHRIAKVGDQLNALATHPFYEKHFADAPVDPGNINSIEQFRELPLLTKNDLVSEIDGDPPHGSFHSDEVRLLNLTPAGENRLMPEYNTERDIQRLGEALGTQFRSMGVESGDVVLNCAAYTVFIGGLAMHHGLQAAGATVLPVGPGDSEQAGRFATEYGADGIFAFPSFGLRIADQADISIKYFLGGGEPFTSVPGMREEVRAAFGGDPVVTDLYALSEFVPVAAECRHEDGLHVADEYALLEVIEPDSTEPVTPGERGEVVLTHLDKEAMPLVRYRTGDLTRLVDTHCECGAHLTLPDGVFGRTDNRLKVKGVKLYPDAIVPVLTEFPALTGEFTVTITRERDVDEILITCEADDPAKVDTAALRQAIADELLVTPTVSVESDLDIEAGDQIRDKRFD
jgi:phenylacetate-CoA ligase